MITYEGDTLKVDARLTPAVAGFTVADLLKDCPDLVVTGQIAWETVRKLTDAARRNWLEASVGHGRFPSDVARDIVQNGTASDVRLLAHWATPNEFRSKWDKVDRTPYWDGLVAALRAAIPAVGQARLRDIMKALLYCQYTQVAVIASMMPKGFLPLALTMAAARRDKCKYDYERDRAGQIVDTIAQLIKEDE